jgi:hypothetical protein
MPKKLAGGDMSARKQQNKTGIFPKTGENPLHCAVAVL